jgi:hypothetical protein
MTDRNFDDIIHDLKELEKENQEKLLIIKGLEKLVKENYETPFIHHCKAGLFLEAYSMLEAFINAEFPQIVNPVPKLYKILTHERVIKYLYRKDNAFITWLLETLDTSSGNISDHFIEKAHQKFEIPLTLPKGTGSKVLKKHIEDCGCSTFTPTPNMITDYDAAILLRNQICHSNFDAIKEVQIDSLITGIKSFKDICDKAILAKKHSVQNAIAS